MKIKPNIIFNFEIDMYDWIVHVAYRTDNETFYRYCNEHSIVDARRDTCGDAAIYHFNMENGNEASMSFLDITTKRNDAYLHSVIAHEAFHIAHDVFRIINIPLVLETGEAYGYLVGYVTKKIYEGLAKESKNSAANKGQSK